MLIGRHSSVGRRILNVLGLLALCCLPALLRYFVSYVGWWDWPRASAWYGVLLGLIGAIIIVGELLIWPRKHYRRWRWPGAMQLWLWVHLIAGLVCLPIIVVHSGYNWGGFASAFTMILFLLVIASGVWGLILQQWIPEKILNEIPEETVASQVNSAVELHRNEARLIISKLTEGEIAPSGQASALPRVTGLIAVTLRNFLNDDLDPYLSGGRKAFSPLASPNQSAMIFRRLRAQLPDGSHTQLDRLETLAEIRRQWDRHVRLNAWLHGWLLIHAPVSVMMFLAMIFHAVKALKYW